MNTNNIIKFTVLLVALNSPTITNASPFSDFKLGNSFQWEIDESRIAKMDVASSTAFAESSDGRNSANSFATVVSITIHPSTDGIASSDELSNYEALGKVETSAVIEGSVITATAGAAALANGSSEISSIFGDGAVGLGVNVASASEGISESNAVSGLGSILLSADAQTSGTQQSDAIALYYEGLNSFSTAFLSTSSISKASVFGSLGDLGFSDGAASSLANSDVEALAVSAGHLIEPEDDQSPESGTVKSQTSAFVNEALLTSGGRTDFFADGLSELLNQSINELVNSKSSASALGITISDVTAALLANNTLTMVSKAAFLNVGWSESFADFENSDNQLSAANGVQTIIFGYTETVITQSIPEPDSFSLVLFGLVMSWAGWLSKSRQK